MKRLLIIPLIALAAGCGSAGATSTVTAPAKTVHVQDTSNSMQLSACQQAMEQLIDAEGKTLDSATQFSNGNITKATATMDNVTHRLNVVRPLVDMCRG